MELIFFSYTAPTYSDWSFSASLLVSRSLHSVSCCSPGFCAVTCAASIRTPPSGGDSAEEKNSKNRRKETQKSQTHQVTILERLFSFKFRCDALSSALRNRNTVCRKIVGVLSQCIGGWTLGSEGYSQGFQQIVPFSFLHSRQGCV